MGQLPAGRRRRQYGLWRQLKDLYGHGVRAELVHIWTEAEKVIVGDPAHHARARARAVAWTRCVHRLWMPEVERNTLLWVIGQVSERGFPRVTCPCREVGEAIGVSHVAAWAALDALTDQGFLDRHFRGIWAGYNSSLRRAAIYSLSDPVKFFGKDLVEGSLGVSRP